MTESWKDLPRRDALACGNSPEYRYLATRELRVEQEIPGIAPQRELRCRP